MPFFQNGWRHFCRVKMLRDPVPVSMENIVHPIVESGLRSPVKGYLAHGLGERATALQNHLENLDKMGQVPRNEVVIGALLTVCIDDAPTNHIILLPGGDATEVQVKGTPIQVLSASSPMARQLRDSVAGDAEEIELGGRFVEIELIAIE